MAIKKIIKGDGTEQIVAGYQFTKEKLVGQKPYTSSKKISKLPPKIDLREHLTLVENQQQTSSCVANAVAGAYEYLVKQHLQDDSYDVSRLFIYYNARYLGDIKGDSGSYISDAIKGLKEYGACSENTWPFEKDLINDEPGEEAYDEAVNFLIEDTQLVKTNLDAWKSCLAEGYPLIFAIRLFDSFDKQRKKGLVPLPTPQEKNRKSHSGHAMLCVGYSDTDQLFIVRNSWGENWGDSGYCYIPYDYLMNEEYNFGDSWIIRRLENVDFTESDWGDDSSIVGDFETELSYMSDGDYNNLLEACDEYPLELRLAILYLQVANADIDISDEEFDEIEGYLQEIIDSLGVSTSTNKLLKRAITFLEDQDLLEESIDLLGEHLSTTMLASIINSLTEIADTDETSEEEQTFLDTLVQRWQVDTEGNPDDDDEAQYFEIIKKTKLYADADKKSEVLLVLEVGDTVAFSEDIDDDWSYVSIDDQEGYVLNSCVEWEENEDTEESDDDDESQYFEIIKKTKLYAEADKKSEVLLVLEVGDTVVFSEDIDDDWSYVAIDDQEGYVLNACVEWEESEDTDESEEEAQWFEVIKKTKLYAEADKKSEVLIELVVGDMVAFSEDIDDDWSYVLIDDQEGYILNSCVEWEAEE
jgi:C1A family cysteine protease